MTVCLLVDATNIYCANHAKLAHLKMSSGYSTGGLYGTIRSIHALEDAIGADATYLAFEGERSWEGRFVEQATYKADRDRSESLWYKDHKIELKAWAMNSGRGVGEGEYMEADDVICQLHRQVMRGIDPTVVIMSKDHDMKALLNEDTFIRARKDEKAYTILDFQAEFGFSPDRYPEYLALCGDATDNVPAYVKPAEAKEIIGKFASLEEASKSMPFHPWSFIMSNLKVVKMRDEGATVHKDVPHRPALREWYSQYEMNSLVKRMEKGEFAQP